VEMTIRREPVPRPNVNRMATLATPTPNLATPNPNLATANLQTPNTNMETPNTADTFVLAKVEYHF